MEIHEKQTTLTFGAPLDSARVGVLLIHGRGATAESMRDLARQLPHDDIAYVMPQAANNTWYPNSGFGPFQANEPYLASAFNTIEQHLSRLRDAGLTNDKIVLGGFSQGACLSSEYAARHAGRYGALLFFSGALMGPGDTPRDYAGSLDGTPVFIGGVDQDSWVTTAQLNQTADVFRQLGGEVTLDIVAGRDHTIRAEEIAQATQILNQL